MEALNKSSTQKYGSVSATNSHSDRKSNIKYYIAFIIAFLICITLRFELYNGSNKQLNHKHSADPEILPLCSKGVVGTKWNNNLLIFGGDARLDTNSLRLNYILYLNISNTKWHALLPQNKKKHKLVKPKGLWKADGILHSDNLYIYGGSTGKHKDSMENILWRYSINDNKWDILGGGNKNKHNKKYPYVRAHCMSLYDNTIILFGGKNASGYDQNWLMYYNIDEPKNGFTYYPIEKCVLLPEPRQAATCQMVRIENQRKFVIFGGRQEKKTIINGTLNKTFKYFNDLWLFDINTLKWTEVLNDKSGQKPTATAHLSSVIYQNKLVVTAGHNLKNVLSQNWMFDFNETKWSQLQSLPDNQNRCEHVAQYMEDKGMIVFGGQQNLPNLDLKHNPDKRLNSVLLYDFNANKWDILRKNNCNDANKYWSHRQNMV